MRIYDISMVVRPGMVFWPDTTAPEMGWETRMADGDHYDSTWWRFGAHNGTHVDAPSHFIPGAAMAADEDLERLVGPARVVAVDPSVDVIDRAVVEGLDLAGVQRVLFQTANGGSRAESSTFDRGYVAFTGDGAQAVADAGIVAVGIDYLSVERFGQPRPVAHLALFGAGIAVIEGLDLRGVPPGDYVLYCLPLRLVGGEAAPARAILVSDDRS